MRLEHWIMVTLFVSACGARTGLGVPMFEAGARDAASVDAGRDAGRDAMFDAGPNCTPNVTLLPAHADVVLALDRSGSMSMPLAIGSTETRWQSLDNALGATLPSFAANIAFGATIFPTARGSVCGVTATLDVPIGLGNARPILSALRAFPPSGGTPTADALVVAESALAARRSMGVPQAIVLCTDGGPNCNPSGIGQSWYGLAPETCVAGGIPVRNCLDDARTIDRITMALAAGVPTYVIAMSVNESYLVDALNRMAIAGGRARTTGTTYYDVQNPRDLTAAFEDIAMRVSSCSFVPSSDVPRDVIVLRVREEIIARDDSRTNGWTIGATGTFDLYGRACDLATMNGATVRIDGVCR